MKKNISINISGIIFHIEEDGYDQLKEYLESINRYFSTFDDSLEIIADIETRIAEIFLSKLNDGKQVIAIEDVEELIATMGSIKDFQAAEEESNYAVQEEETVDDEEEAEPIFSKRLYRDNNRKLAAGVLSGIAYYFNIDPLWIRLIFVLLFFGVSILPSIAGVLFIFYIVMWIVVPPSDDLKEEKKIKKMYRDPDAKVLGGVASGIAAYFGVDVVIIRLLFFASIFIAGTGLILYIILWIILPEAKTLTDRMEMQGQPVTLSNIESNIKKSLNVTEGDENVFVKILLFPFRLIAALFEFLSKALGPFMSFLVEALRVVFGALLTLIGLGSILAVLIATGVVVGLFAGGDIENIYPVPFEIIQNDLQILPGIALLIALIIPMFFLAILGVMILLKRSVLNPKAGWSVLALWLISIIVLSFTIPPYVHNFRETSRHTTVDRYNLYDKTAVLRFNDIGEDQFELVSLRIKNHKDTLIRLDKEFIASGKNRQDATANAKMINYGFNIMDSTLTFDSRIEFEADDRFRKQELMMTIYLPEGQKFMMEEDLKYLIGSFMYKEGYSNRQMTGNVWTFDEEQLVCLTCPEEPGNQIGKEDDWDISGYNREYDLGEFDEIKINSAFKVNVKKASDNGFIIKGDKSDIDDVVVEKTGATLSVDFKGDSKLLNDRDHDMTLYITMPNISALELSSASKVSLVGFKEDYLDIRMEGAAFAEMNIDVTSINAEIEGASKLVLNGSGEQMEMTVKGASTYDGTEYIVDELILETFSASTARVYARELLKINSYGVSNVVYQGTAEVEIDKSGKSSVRKE